MIIIDGKKLASAILENIKEEISKLNFVPIFCDVLVGNDPVSKQYVRMKMKVAEEVGMIFHKANFPVNIPLHELLKEIEKLNLI